MLVAASCDCQLTFPGFFSTLTGLIHSYTRIKNIYSATCMQSRCALKRKFVPRPLVQPSHLRRSDKVVEVR